MTRVVPIRFKYNPKTYWFSYEGSDPVPGDWVLVARDGGKVFGWVEDEPFTIDERCEKDLKSPIKPILRVADEQDLNKLEELWEKGAEAKKTFRRLAEKRGLGIKPIDVEYLLDCDRAVFHFSSEDRVDFRDLVKDLASSLHVHVDMRQIGVRDEARLVGGLGHCGEVLCCVRMSSAFQPVSIKMAKDQDLPLNPTKVSGACGRLMCCLRYESEAYKDFKSRAPKVGAMVTTPAGDAKVAELNTPKELVKVKMVEGGESFFVPLEGMERDLDKSLSKPSVVTEKAFSECAPSSLTRDKGFEVPVEELLSAEEAPKGKRRRKKGGKKGDAQKPANGESKQKKRTSAEPGEQKGRRKKAAGEAPKQGQPAKGGERRQRPGQHSSNIQNPGNDQNPKGSSRRRRRGGGQGRNSGASHSQQAPHQQQPQHSQQSQHLQHQQHERRGNDAGGSGAESRSGQRSRRRRPRRASGKAGAPSADHKGE